ncbi:TonB-dependent receptor [Mucilaginibacter sp. BT774]|uniref:SusC/RagA family TonB-linked outer membrane protein n=1 Tax=Mucilaginibacter sp. BT774 TaxID=3062276 RepID=UPI0026745842|nr:TonB-dependent receptor [Mucilaginibacter sp. BT774]MDO3629047.1 TonB-dependent receptor [Mucilaginibacter sp. BT774]
MNLNILQHLKSPRNIGTTLCLIGALNLNALPTAFASEKTGAGHENLIALVKGKVTDSKGQPLPGAIVKVKGTPKGTAADATGQFSIDAQPGSVLVISFVGFIPKEVTVSDNTFLTIQLQEDARSMQEVVVVGYGAVKKSDLTGSVSSVKADDLNLGGTTSNIGQAIQGKAAGVQVQQSSFAPGGGINITIRGGNSINTSNAPLYVVDGFISDNGNVINPNDIEDIEVLKDASATAIYGSRGGNGVVLITTKKGKLGKANIDADVSNGRQYLTYKPSLLTGPQYAAIQNATFTEDGKTPPFPSGTQIANTNWLNAAMQNADVNNRSLSISSGNETSKLYVSGNYLNQLGVLKNTNLQKYTARIGTEKKVGDDLTISANFYGASSSSNQQSYSGDITAPLYGLLTAPPSAPIYNPDGSFHFYIPPGNSGVQNALANLLEPTDNLEGKLFNGNVTVDYQIIKNLTYHLNAGSEYSESNEGKYTPSTIPAGAANHGIASIQNKNAFRWLVENYFTYKFKINDQHDFNLLLGTSNQKDVTESLYASSKNFSTDEFSYHNLAAGSISNGYTSSKFQNTLIDYFGRVNYAYKDKLLATFTLRRDGSAQFGSNNRYGYFPSGALAYRLGDESFIRNLNTFSSLKVRVSYGVTGNDRLPVTNNNNYQYLAAFTNWNVVLNPDGTLLPGIEPATLYNPNLKWESTAQLDFGLDMGFLNDRITATLDLYRKKTSDLLMQIPIGQYYGFSSVWANGGSIENKGIELSINTANIKSTDFSWNTTFNIAYNKQKDLTLAKGVAEVDATTANPSGVVSGQQFTKLVPGQELGELYGYVYAGVIKTGETYAPQPSSKPGDPKFADLNGDGKITPADRTYLGNSTPRYILGFGNDFRYKGFDLNIFFQGAFGYHLFDMNRLVLESTTSTDALNRFVLGVNENTSIPREGYFMGTYSNNYVNSRFVEDASYLRLKSLSLGYNMPKSLFTHIKHIQGLRIYGTAQNLLTFTSYKGTDPEVNAHTTTATAINTGGGLDFNSFPAFRTFALGIRLSLQ